jgi:hypothetical protein
MAANPGASSSEDESAVSEEDVFAMDRRVAAAAASAAQRVGGDSEMSEMKLYVDDEVPVARDKVSDSVEHVPDAVEHAPVADDEVPDSVEHVPDAVDEVSVAGDKVLDSVEELPDIDEGVECPSYSTFHGGGVFGEACYQARRNARRCGRCRLLHEDYDMTSWILYDLDKFDCELIIPDVEKPAMRGETIIVPEQIVKKLEKKMKHATNTAQANQQEGSTCI